MYEILPVYSQSISVNKIINNVGKDLYRKILYDFVRRMICYAVINCRSLINKNNIKIMDLIKYPKIRFFNFYVFWIHFTSRYDILVTLVNSNNTKNVVSMNA